MSAKKIKVEGPEDDKQPDVEETLKDGGAKGEQEASCDDSQKTEESDGGEQPLDEEAIAAEADAAVEAAEKEAAFGSDDELAAAKAQTAEMQDKYLRLKAEWDNFRKRTASERDDERKRATQRLASSLLPVLDDFERAIEHAKANPDVDTLREGVEAVHAKMLDVLGKEHLVKIEALGQPFDANLHQAVSTKEDFEAFDETVVQVFQNGYMMGEKVLRPAMVVVSTGGPKRPPEDNPNEEPEKK